MPRTTTRATPVLRRRGAWVCPCGAFFRVRVERAPWRRGWRHGRGRHVLPEPVGQKERRTVGRQYLRDGVDHALCHRHPEPLGRTLQPRDRLGLTEKGL